MVRFLILLIIPITLSGCVIDYVVKQGIRNFMDGPKFCPADEMNKVVQNRRAYKNLSNRLRRQFVHSNMDYLPDRTEHMTAENGYIYVADYYQTTASLVCGGEGVFGEYEPVFYLGDVVVGKGETFYREKLERKIVEVDVVE